MPGQFLRQSSDSTSHRPWGLTPEILEKARGRVRVLAWLMLATMLVGSVLDTVMIAAVGGQVGAGLIGTSVFVIAITGGLLYLSYAPHVRHTTVLYATLAFEVVACFFISYVVQVWLYEETGHLPLTTWAAAFIIIFPLIVPSPPRLTLTTALLAGATRPLSMLLLDLREDVVVGGIDYYASVVNPLFAVAVAYVGSRVVHGLTSDLATAQRMGSYTLESLLGSGGMGEVWKARHQLLARPAAVKFVKPEALAGDWRDQQTALARFEQEAQVTANLRSAHTIQLFDFGRASNGAFYYVMELLDGLDLDALVRRFGPVTAGRATHLLLQACDSLGEAHAQGLIHRDVKPGNIYACRYGRAVDFVKVLDFGLVKLAGGPRDTGITRAADGQVGGTPAFLAPEQALGREVDARADIYQLGCVAYWLLTGTRVFDGDSAMSVIMMHVQATPDRPSSRTEQVIPPELDELILACLEKEPGDRPQSVDVIAERLMQSPVPEPWNEARRQRWWATHLPDPRRQGARATAFDETTRA